MPAARPMIAGLAAAFLALGPLAALAGPVADQATKADQLAESGDFVGALAAADELKGVLWDQQPNLSFLNAFPVTERSAGYGLYNPRPTARGADASRSSRSPSRDRPALRPVRAL